LNQELERFCDSIEDFSSLTAGDVILYFILFLTPKSSDYATVSSIRECFLQLDIIPYSNISAFLGNKSQKKNALLIKSNSGYRLTRECKKKLEERIERIKPIVITDSLIDFSIFNECPYHIKKIAEEMCQCYEVGLYNPTLVMMRKLIETLIIECFERFGVQSEIKDGNGFYKFLSELIPAYLRSSKWTASRNINQSLNTVKKYGDLSAHNRRYISNKKTLDSFKNDLEQALQEIILLIDYPNWVLEKKTK